MNNEKPIPDLRLDLFLLFMEAEERLQIPLAKIIFDEPRGD